MKKTEEAFDGKRSTRETLIFPRYHQWEVVNKLLATTVEEGAGKRYLIQHSAGSGKSNSIAWVAHQLASLYGADGSRLFNSVIVVTDRTVLDDQLQRTIYQFEHAQGVVRPITRDIGNQSKSEQLADALTEQTRIIIVTFQTFPALFDALDARPDLGEGRYAVIADEAHSSQSGAAASKLKTLLGADKADEEEVSAEELLEMRPWRRASPPSASATMRSPPRPRARRWNSSAGRGTTSCPRAATTCRSPSTCTPCARPSRRGSSSMYSMNYTTYSTAWWLAHPDGDEYEVDSRKASARLARWVKLHPYNINQKVEVIVEHFRTRVRHLLNRQAKAMVVTGSRQEAVRYALAMRGYLAEHGVQDVHPLVAFSGTVPPDDTIPQEVTEHSALLNPGLKGRDHAEALDTDEFNVLIVANKYQTGFDQPKLCAMYVDKKLQGVDCVQTLSRLNRIFPGKETFILDFVNDEQDILAAFRPYYNKAELADLSDPNVVYDLQRKLDATGIYHWEEVEQFARAFFDPKASSTKLSYYCKPATDRFMQRYKAAQEQRQIWKQAKREAERNGDEAGVAKAEHEIKEAGEAVDELDLFRRDLQSFVRSYEFLSQIISYDDLELEQLCVFAKLLYPRLHVDRLDQDEIDLSELALTHYRMTKRQEQRLQLRIPANVTAYSAVRDRFADGVNKPV